MSNYGGNEKTGLGVKAGTQTTPPAVTKEIMGAIDAIVNDDGDVLELYKQCQHAAAERGMLHYARLTEAAKLPKCAQLIKEGWIAGPENFATRLPLVHQAAFLQPSLGGEAEAFGDEDAEGDVRPDKLLRLALWCNPVEDAQPMPGGHGQWDHRSTALSDTRPVRVLLSEMLTEIMAHPIIVAGPGSDPLREGVAATAGEGGFHIDEDGVIHEGPPPGAADATSEQGLPFYDDEMLGSGAPEVAPAAPSAEELKAAAEQHHAEPVEPPPATEKLAAPEADAPPEEAFDMLDAHIG